MKNKDIKIIFVDIDGTILDHSKKVSKFDKASIKALKKAQKNGVLVYLCTARPYESVKSTGLFDLFKADGMILTNGSLAISNGNIIHNDAFPLEIVLKILKVCEEMNLVVELSSEYERWFNKLPNEYVYNYLKIYREEVAPTRDFNHENITTILLYCPKEMDEEFQSKVGYPLSYYRFTEYGVDINTHKIYKSQGITKVLEYLHLSSDDALAFGDEEGDIKMFESCKYSVCLANGHPDAKVKAKYVSNTVTHHGVKKGLKHYKVI